jgi:hypothetical protein
MGVGTTETTPGVASGIAVMEEPSTLLTDLLSYYTLDADGADSHGANPLTNSGTVTFAAGKLNNAAIFSSTSGRLTAAYNISYAAGVSGAGASWSVWLRTDISDSGLSVLSGEDTTSNSSWRIQDAQSNSRMLGFVRASGVLVSSPTGTVNDSAWHHFVMTYDPADKLLRAWLDGAGPTTSSAGSQNNLIDNLVGINLGGDVAGSLFGESTVAELDEWGSWNRALTSTEVACLFGSGSPPAYPFEGVCTP